MKKTKHIQQPKLVLESFDYFEAIELGDDLQDLQIAQGAIGTGVTLIEETEAHLPVYLASRISVGRNAFDTISVNEAQVSYFATTALSKSTHGNAMGFKKKREQTSVAFYRLSEEVFWAAPEKLLSVIGDATCVFVEVTDSKSFTDKLELISKLDADAKAKGVAVVLACSWALEMESRFPIIRVLTTETGFSLKLNTTDGKPLELAFTWDDGESDYRFDAFKGMNKKESSVRFYHSLGYSHVELVDRLGISMGTVKRYLDKPEQSAAA